MADGRANFAQWHKLQPLNQLNENDLELLYSMSEIKTLQPRTLLGAEQGWIYFLLEGQVSLLSGGFVTETFNHLEQRALSPLFNDTLEEDAAVLTSHGSILRVDRDLFEGLYNQSRASLIRTSEIDLSQGEHELLQSMLRAFEHKKLDLPALPEAALRIRRAINTPDVGTSEIIQIVQSDPVLSARLVKVANSPLYGTWREIKTVRDAVRRLGLETTKNLSFSLSVKQLFSARTSLVKEYIHELYNESLAIAAIAYVVTQNQALHLDAEQALLSGLILNLGKIPILKYLDEHPNMLQSVDMLGKSIEHLHVPISTLIFNEWNFDPVFIEIVEQSDNWHRDSDKPADYCDVVIAARLIYLHDQDELPVERLGGLPVIEKLRLLEFDDNGDFFIDNARLEIEEMQRLLNTV